MFRKSSNKILGNLGNSDISKNDAYTYPTKSQGGVKAVVPAGKEKWWYLIQLQIEHG